MNSSHNTGLFVHKIIIPINLVVRVLIANSTRRSLLAEVMQRLDFAKKLLNVVDMTTLNSYGEPPRLLLRSTPSHSGGREYACCCLFTRSDVNYDKKALLSSRVFVQAGIGSQSGNSSADHEIRRQKLLRQKFQRTFHKLVSQSKQKMKTLSWQFR